MLSNWFLDRSGHPRAAWRFALFLSVYLLAVIICAATVSLATNAARHWFVVSPLLEGLLMNAGAGCAAVIIATAFVLRVIEHQPPAYIGLGGERGWLPELAAGFALGAGMIVLVALLEWVTGHLRVYRAGGSHQAGWLAVMLVLFALGALHEELLFRGYAFQRLIESLGPLAGVLILAALFGVIHLGNPNASAPGAVNTALVGAVFAVAYLKTGRLWLPIGMHWAWNFTEGLLGLPVSGIRIEGMPFATEYGGRALFHGGDYGPEASIFATGVIACVMIAMLLRRGKPLSFARSLRAESGPDPNPAERMHVSKREEP